MTEELYQHLEKEWKYRNHKKYHRYFEEWVSNISESQIYHFDKMRLNVDVYKN